MDYHTPRVLPSGALRLPVTDRLAMTPHSNKKEKKLLSSLWYINIDSSQIMILHSHIVFVTMMAMVVQEQIPSMFVIIW